MLIIENAENTSAVFLYNFLNKVLMVFLLDSIESTLDSILFSSISALD